MEAKQQVFQLLREKKRLRPGGKSHFLSHSKVKVLLLLVLVLVVLVLVLVQKKDDIFSLSTLKIEGRKSAPFLISSPLSPAGERQEIQ